MKKKYITPAAVIVNLETQTPMLSGSDDAVKKPKLYVDLGGNEDWQVKGEVQVDGDYGICAKGYNAWTTWDE